jgi:hypothetical protein
MVTDLFAGELSGFFIKTLLVTAIVSPLVLWRYSAAVLGGMSVRGGGDLPWPERSAPRAVAPPVEPAARAAWERLAHRRAALAWASAFFAAALLLAAVWSRAGGMPLGLAQLGGQAMVYAQVGVPVVALALGWHWRQGLRAWLVVLVAGMVGMLLLSVIQRLVSGRMPTPDQAYNALAYLQLAAVTLAPALLLLLASGPSRLRGVAPMAFSGLVLFAAAPFFGYRAMLALADTEAGGRAMLEHPLLGSRHLLFALLALPFGALMAWRLHALAAAYARKRFSELELLARAWWLMFCCLMGLTLVAGQDGSITGALGCLLAAVALVPLLRLAFTLVRPARDAPPPRTLLVLRVFGFRGRTERLLDRIGARWRWHGPVTMIAAPDVVARTIDPVDFVGWLLGRSSESFVRSQAELAARLAAIDTVRDPDGRHRISEFCCADHSWRATVVALMDRADVVLMDLRGLVGERKGCEFELRQLAERVDPSRVVLVVEPDADRAPLQALLGAAAPRVHWCELPDRASADTEPLLKTLLVAAR